MIRNQDGTYKKQKTYLEKMRDYYQNEQQGKTADEWENEWRKRNLPTLPKMTRSSSSGYRSVFEVNGVEITIRAQRSKDSKRETDRLVAFYSKHLAEFGNDIVMKDDIEKAKKYERRFFDLRGDMGELLSALEATDKAYKKARQSYKEIMVLVSDDVGEEEEPQTTEKKKERKTGPCELYFISDKQHDVVKIGISKDPEKRAKHLQTACGFPLEITNRTLFQTEREARDAEAFLHNKYSWARIQPDVTESCEWFNGEIISDLMEKYSTAEKIGAAFMEEKADIERRREMSNQACECYWRAIQEATIKMSTTA